MLTQVQTDAAVIEALNGLVQAYDARDMERMMSYVAPDDDLFLFGTGIDEKRLGADEFRRQAERDWAQTDALAFDFTWHRASSAGPVAWLAAEGTGRGSAGGEGFEFPIRLTAVLVNEDGRWLIRQSHFSVPSASQEEGDSVPV